MIPYFDELLQEEQETVTNVIQMLQRQTFILERKFDRRQGRFLYSRDYRICSKHLEFIREYFRISGIEVREDSQMGVIYIQGETVMGEKLSRLATLYLLILKVIYDEQMMTASTAAHIYTTLGELSERLGAYGLISRLTSTEVKRAITVLKKYQIVEPADIMDDFDGSTRLIIYPTVNLVLMGDDAREILADIGIGSGGEKTEDAETNGEETEEDSSVDMAEDDMIEETMEEEDGHGRTEI